jgi:hypothetical protein
MAGKRSRAPKQDVVPVTKQEDSGFEARYVGPLSELQGFQNGIWMKIPTKDQAINLASKRSFHVRRVGSDSLLTEQQVMQDVRASSGEPTDREIAVAAREADRRTLKPTKRKIGDVPHEPGYTPSQLEAGDLPPAGLPIPEDGQSRQVLKNPASQRMNEEHKRDIQLSRLPADEAAALGMDPKAAIRSSTARISETFKNTPIRAITRVG